MKVTRNTNKNIIVIIIIINQSYWAPCPPWNIQFKYRSIETLHVMTVAYSPAATVGIL
jgi:hypothetical protein